MKVNHDKARYYVETVSELDDFLRHTASFAITRHLRMIENLKFLVDNVQFNMGYQFKDEDECRRRHVTLNVKVTTKGEGDDQHQFEHTREFSVRVDNAMDTILYAVTFNVRQALTAVFQTANMAVQWPVGVETHEVDSNTISDLATHYVVALDEEKSMPDYERWEQCDCPRCKARKSIADKLEEIRSQAGHLDARNQSVLNSFVWLAEKALQNDPQKFTEVRDHVMIITSGDIDLSGAAEQSGLKEDEIMIEAESLIGLVVMTTAYAAESARKEHRVN